MYVSGHKSLRVPSETAPACSACLKMAASRVCSSIRNEAGVQ
jgi:hypothetical protein